MNRSRGNKMKNGTGEKLELKKVMKQQILGINKNQWKFKKYLELSDNENIKY